MRGPKLPGDAGAQANTAYGRQQLQASCLWLRRMHRSREVADIIVVDGHPLFDIVALSHEVGVGNVQFVARFSFRSKRTLSCVIQP